MSQNRNVVVVAWLNDAALGEMLDVVLGYESVSRGLTRGQAAYRLVMEAALAEPCPERFRGRLDELEARRRARAVEESLSASRRGKVA